MKWWRRHKPNRRNAPEVPANWRRSVLLSIGALSLAAAVVFAVHSVHGSDWERFRALEVTGELRRVTPLEVRRALEPFLAQGFAGIDMRSARAALVDLPWIAEASLRRQWPATLAVSLREERPVATWYGTALMNAAGEVFVDGVDGLSGVLPDIAGPAGSQQDMVQRLNELERLAAERGLDLRRLLRSERRAERFWVRTAGGEGIEVRLGRRDTDLRLQRFLAVAWPALQAHAPQVAYVDMRYTNGFAVGWKTVQGGEPPRERG